MEKLQDHTWEFLLDEREHSEVYLAVSHYDLPLESIHYCWPWRLRVHLERERERGERKWIWQPQGADGFYIMYDRIM